MNEIMKLNPVSFKWKENDAETKLGLIAQELKEVLPETVRDWEWKQDSEGQTKGEKIPAARLGVFYSDLIPVVIKGMQEMNTELKVQNQELKSEVRSQKSDIEYLKSQLIDMQKDLSQCCSNNEQKSVNGNFSIIDVARLEQNNPNPFKEHSEIKCFIPSTASEASIKIYSLEGVELKSFNILERGTAQVSITGNSFSAGVYVYTLFVDGKTIDTKQMVLTK
jgi:predicted RNase H-like nuclease (RuvC/YqgF family)